MELYQLQSFMAVASAGSLSKAAETRNISLPGISKHIKLLEETVGHALFTRSSQGMELTPKGTQVLQHAHKIQEGIDSILDLGSETKQIKVGLNLSPEFVELSVLKEKMEEHCGKKEIAFTNLNSSELLEKL